VAPGPEGVEVGRSVDEAPGGELREAGGGVRSPREVPVPEFQENDLRRRENDAPVDPSAPGAVVCSATTRHEGSSHPPLHHLLNSAHNIPRPPQHPTFALQLLAPVGRGSGSRTTHHTPHGDPLHPVGWGGGWRFMKEPPPPLPGSLDESVNHVTVEI